jgi:hypothetical protein
MDFEKLQYRAFLGIDSCLLFDDNLIAYCVVILMAPRSAPAVDNDSDSACLVMGPASAPQLALQQPVAGTSASFSIETAKVGLFKSE